MAGKDTKDKQPDIEDDQAVIEWVTDTNVSPTERSLRANEIYSRESRRPRPRGHVMNAISDVRSVDGPPHANS